MTAPKNRWEAKWLTFTMKTPQIAKIMTQFAKQLIHKGFRQYSMYSLFNRVRWHVEVETKGDGTFKLNNNFAPYYARLPDGYRANVAGFLQDTPSDGGILMQQDLFEDEDFVGGHDELTLDGYRAEATEFAFYSMTLMYLVLGLNGEAGEVAEKLKKLIRDNDLDFSRAG